MYVAVDAGGSLLSFLGSTLLIGTAAEAVTIALLLLQRLRSLQPVILLLLGLAIAVPTANTEIGVVATVWVLGVGTWLLVDQGMHYVASLPDGLDGVARCGTTVFVLALVGALGAIVAAMAAPDPETLALRASIGAIAIGAGIALAGRQRHQFRRRRSVLPMVSHASREVARAFSARVRDGQAWDGSTADTFGRLRETAIRYVETKNLARKVVQ